MISVATTKERNGHIKNTRPGLYSSISLIQSLKTQVFCVADFATLSDERGSRSKIVPLLNTDKRTLRSKFWRAHTFENSLHFANWISYVVMIHDAQLYIRSHETDAMWGNNDNYVKSIVFSFYEGLFNYTFLIRIRLSLIWLICFSLVLFVGHRPSQ